MKINFNQSPGTPIWLNYHHLYYFMIIATEGSIAVAAKKLSIGPPALSIQIKQLEANLGMPLFERSHKKLTLTESGKSALAYAKEIFQLGNEMVEALHDQPSHNRIHLQIGSPDSIPKHLILQLAQKALLISPCSISILEGGSDYLIRELMQHRLDLLVTNRVIYENQQQLYSKKIARLPLLVLGHQKFKHCKHKFPNSLTGEPFIVPTSDSHVRHEIEHYCKLQNIQPDFYIETQDVMMQKLMAIQGLGLIAIPEFAAHEYLKRKELHIIGTMQGVYEELFLVAASRKIENPIATKLMKEFIPSRQ
jgi:LysR family transcriptional activator of nhaA